MNSNKGRLKVRVYTADNALPISGANVTVYGKNGIEKETVANLKTDVNGQTEPILLETAPNSLSQSPSENEPYYCYDIRVEHPLYSGKYYVDVPIFPNITTLQPVALLPLQNGETFENLEYIFEKEPADL